MDFVSSDVLSKVVEKLSIKQKYQLLTVSVKFQEASDWALKKHKSLVTQLPQGRVKCFVGDHLAKVSDFIQDKWLEDKDEQLMRRHILTRLPRLKFFRCYSMNGDLMKDLSLYCPQLQCLDWYEISFGTSCLTRQPYVLHVSSTLPLNDFLAKQFLETFPSLEHVRLESEALESSSFCEGMQTLNVNVSSSPSLTFLFSSPAMKTIKKMKLVGLQSATKVSFNAPNLNELKLVSTFSANKQLNKQFCTLLSKSLSYSPRLTKFVLKSQDTEPIKLPNLLFYTINTLTSITLPTRLENTDEVLEVICSMNVFLESVKIGSIFGDYLGWKKQRVLDSLSSLTKLKFLKIDNIFILEGEHALTLKELDGFITRNTVNGNLRFSFFLLQDQNFPGDEFSRGKTVWKGIHWISDTSSFSQFTLTLAALKKDAEEILKDFEDLKMLNEMRDMTYIGDVQTGPHIPGISFISAMLFRVITVGRSLFKS